MYKLVAIDMDGTLLKDNKTISRENYDAIQIAKGLGVKIVLATGRPFEGIKPYLKYLDLLDEDDYAVVFNGAAVQNTKNENIVTNSILGMSDWNYLYSLSRSLNVNIHALTLTSCITPRINKFSTIESTSNNIPLIIDNPLNMKAITQFCKIMFVDEAEILARAIDRLSSEVFIKYTVVKSCPVFLEFLNLKANKGLGVKKIAHMLNIKQDEIICIGDADNDRHMISYAGLGVAMGNATTEIKDNANYVTLSNENNGVAHVINKFILNKV
jgi:Cof subfamily protein (haloacid dehalogenase superfamily)